MNKPDIAVAIPTYRREEVLLDTIHDVLAQSHENLELLVLDQSESHNPTTIKALEEIKDKRLRYFRLTPPCLPAARNYALKVAEAPLVLFIDDDVKLDKKMVHHHLQAFKKHPEVSAVGGRVMQDGFPVKKEVLKFDAYAKSNGVFTATEADYTNAFPGGNHTIKVKDALKVGGYDTRYYYNAFREESDMAMKMVRAGMKIYYEPKAELLHLATPSGGTRAKKYKELYDTPMFYRNELFFTLRAASDKMGGLRQKYDDYCFPPSRRRAYIRRIYFYLGLAAAVWRMAFGRRVVSTERKA